MSTLVPDNENQRLESLRELRVLGTPPEQVYDDIARLAALVCDTPIAVIAFVDKQRVWYKSKINLVQEEIQRDGSFCTHAILQSQVLTVVDPLSDDKFVNNCEVAEFGIRFYAGMPLITDDAHPVGTLAVMDRVPHLMTAEQGDALGILTRQVVRELELRRARATQLPRWRLRLVLPAKPPVTVLIVEDNDNLRNLLQRTLEAVGFSVLAAPDGTEGLRLCQQHNGIIDLLVSDIAMFGLNGVELSQ